MSDNKVTSSQGYDKIVCEAIGCSLNATDTIDIQVGADRTITLFLCSNCKAKLRFESSRKDILQH